MNIDYLATGTIISIILRVASAVILLFFVIPLQIRENKVHNGLIKLRRQLLFSGISIFLIIVVGIFIMALRLYEPVYRDELTFIFSIINSIGFLIVALIKYQIYHTQYTPESKEHHRIIEKMEKGELKVSKAKGGTK